MSEQEILIVIEADGEVDNRLAEDIQSQTGGDVRLVGRNGLAGEVATWLLVGNFAVTALATLAPIAAKAFADRRVKSLKVGDLVIENPSAEQISTILSSWTARSHGSA